MADEFDAHPANEENDEAVVVEDEATLLADLNGGAGVTLGSLDITDREGNNAVVSLAGDVTVQDAIDYIKKQV